jgi:hypothetical protein
MLTGVVTHGNMCFGTETMNETFNHDNASGNACGNACSNTCGYCVYVSTTICTAFKLTSIHY